MPRRTSIHDRVAGGILDATADLLTRTGELPSMSEVAEAAGIARATLYRYFPAREQLLQALITAAVEVTAAQLAEADLDTVPVTEGIARVARIVAASGSRYAALVGLFGRDYVGGVELPIKTMIDDLLDRGIDDGTFRSDISPDELRLVLGSMLETGARMAAGHQAGVEKAAALITSVFLQGTQNRREPGAGTA